MGFRQTNGQCTNIKLLDYQPEDERVPVRKRTHLRRSYKRRGDWSKFASRWRLRGGPARTWGGCFRFTQTAIVEASNDLISTSCWWETIAKACLEVPFFFICEKWAIFNFGAASPEEEDESCRCFYLWRIMTRLFVFTRKKGLLVQKGGALSSIMSPCTNKIGLLRINLNFIFERRSAELLCWRVELVWQNCCCIAA